MSNRFSFLLLAILIGLIVSVSAESVPEPLPEMNEKFDSITVKFVDALTLEPIVNSQITTYFDKEDNGDISEEKFYTTDSEGKIIVPVEGKVHYFRSDKGDNNKYISQGDSILISILEEPEHTIYLSPIFSVNVELETDFNFLLSFFRVFRYGSYLEAPASELNLGSVIEPNCFMTTLKKGKTVQQYSKNIPLRVYFSRDLNSPTKEPYKCSVYAWEGVRKVAGITELNFSSFNRDEVNDVRLALDRDYEELLADYPRIRPPESS